MKKLVLFGAMVIMAVSCTPESVEEIYNNDAQSIDKEKYQVPPNG